MLDVRCSSSTLGALITVLQHRQQGEFSVSLLPIALVVDLGIRCRGDCPTPCAKPNLMLWSFYLVYS